MLNATLYRCLGEPAIASAELLILYNAWTSLPITLPFYFLVVPISFLGNIVSHLFQETQYLTTFYCSASYFSIEVTLHVCLSTHLHKHKATVQDYFDSMKDSCKYDREFFSLFK